MRRLIMLLFCAVCTVSMTFAQDAKKKKDSVTFFIEAMDCDHCIKKIEKNIAFEKGVTDLKCVLVDNGAGCPVPPAKKSEHTHAH